MNRKEYYKSEETAFVIVEVEDDEARVTEKRDEWCAPFWIPLSEFRETNVSKVGNLSDEQFEQIRRKD